MNQSIILGIGTGRCGTGSLAKVLNQQPEAVCSFEEAPLLPWRHTDGPRVMRGRFARFRACSKARRLGDCASFYLPYVEDAIAAEPDIRIVCLKRPREEVVASFCQWLDQTMPLPTNHWARQPAPGWHHDPVRTRTFPQYDTPNREDGIRRYWDEYYQRVSELIARYPEVNVRPNTWAKFGEGARAWRAGEIRPGASGGREGRGVVPRWRREGLRAGG